MSADSEIGNKQKIERKHRFAKIFFCNNISKYDEQ